MAKNIVIGVGNLLLSDDGIGVISTSYLRKNFAFEPELELLDGGTLGFNLIEYFLNYDNVFIIDTISIDDEAGSLYKIPSQELLGGTKYKNTAHEVEVVQMLEACELYDKKANITIFGIVPKDINSMKIGLSKSLIENFDMLIETIIKNIQELNIKVTKKANFTLQDIIKEFG
ncbi:MAG: HyaD/HybD family hydrogenase maturation endopeptidase [Sulfurimonas sp.]|uniref:HyaD/HybD family hydrogenase maturation endopeptidase n=1 Tax=Sulfurimonas sp. TaxID=2022749 RepID=UPI0026232702|nr:HyaD/HybD family hydrogenase maturation endopeptidase [Sulfurimonas sp.]MCW8894333.1 HyaD/HybD family hydrogenase maturation endopeptidase [Sulfurimonas sp.]MCW8954236.1 HyaD/HybD family hydrogenase maturation endopeptidase [Sulfurimonas sp.]MCW9066844.1 HyaD/HybD family hydrogenase maturation endopeptidase [Sulfurimonas sp.]